MILLRYSPDVKLLKLQQLAKEKQFGSIWSGIRKDIVLGAKQHDFTNCDESIKHMAGFDNAQAQNSGFPVKFYSSSISKPLSFLPWDERRTRKELETATRSQFRDHMGCITTLPYGFVVDMQVAQYVLTPTSYEMLVFMSPTPIQFPLGTNTNKYQ